MSSNDATGWQWASNAILVLAAGIMVFAAIDMRTQRAALTPAFDSDSDLPRAPEAGDLIESVSVKSIDGKISASLTDLTRERAVISFVTTTCPFCRASLASWRSLSEQLAARGISFVMISLDDEIKTADYVRAHEIAWPVWVADNRADLTVRLNVRVVPITLVAIGGQVTSVYRGQFVDEDAHELLRLPVVQRVQ